MSKAKVKPFIAKHYGRLVRAEVVALADGPAVEISMIDDLGTNTGFGYLGPRQAIRFADWLRARAEGATQ